MTCVRSGCCRRESYSRDYYYFENASVWWFGIMLIRSGDENSSNIALKFKLNPRGLEMKFSNGNE